MFVTGASLRQASALIRSAPASDPAKKDAASSGVPVSTLAFRSSVRSRPPKARLTHMRAGLRPEMYDQNRAETNGITCKICLTRLWSPQLSLSGIIPAQTTITAHRMFQTRTGRIYLFPEMDSFYVQAGI